MSAAVLLTQTLAATPATVPLDQVFWSEVLGTGILTLLGCGVVANVVLTKTLGNNGGWLLINIGWGLAVMAGVYTAYKSGAHINPAITLGILVSGGSSYAPGVAVSAGSTIVYVVGQLVGAFLGAVLCWLAYKKHFDAHPGDAGITEVPAEEMAAVGGGTTTNPAHAADRAPVPVGPPPGAAQKLGVFSTGPAIAAPAWNVLTEIIGTFVLVFIVLLFGKTPSGLGPLAVSLLVVGIGASLGGPTGYAINPARDLGPRIAHAVLPFPGKGPSNWGYSWVPIVGPLVGAILAGLVARMFT